MSTQLHRKMQRLLALLCLSVAVLTVHADEQSNPEPAVNPVAFFLKKNYFETYYWSVKQSETSPSEAAKNFTECNMKFVEEYWNEVKDQLDDRIATELMAVEWATMASKAIMPIYKLETEYMEMKEKKLHFFGGVINSGARLLSSMASGRALKRLEAIHAMFYNTIQNLPSNVTSAFKEVQKNPQAFGSSLYHVDSLEDTFKEFLDSRFELIELAKKQSMSTETALRVVNWIIRQADYYMTLCAIIKENDLDPGYITQFIDRYSKRVEEALSRNDRHAVLALYKQRKNQPIYVARVKL